MYSAHMKNKVQVLEFQIKFHFYFFNIVNNDLKYKKKCYETIDPSLDQSILHTCWPLGRAFDFQEWGTAS